MSEKDMHPIPDAVANENGQYWYWKWKDKCAEVERLKVDANRYRALKPLLFFRLDGYTSESGSIEDATHASWGLETGGGYGFETNSGKEPESLDQAIDRMLEGKEGGR